MRSMAVTFYCPPHIPVQKYGSIIRPVNKFLILKHIQLPVKRAHPLQIRSSFKNKVFEDQSEGIICYKDDKGEIVCEGYDEGPRFHQQSTRTAYHPRDAEILDLLQHRYLQLVNGGQFNSADKDVVTLQEDFKWNGYNKFY